MATFRMLVKFGRRCASLNHGKAIGLLRVSLSRENLAKLPSTLKRNWISLSVAGALCAVPVTQVEISHEDLIKRASSLVTDSANTYLSQTTLALLDSLTQYAKAMRVLVTLQKRYETSANRLSPADEEAVWEVILLKREEVKMRREDCKRYESKWMTAINLSELAAEAAYNAGADQASVTARTNLDLAQSQVEQVKQHSVKAEQDLRESKAEDSPRFEPPATLPMEVEEEEDIPEAYLRED